MRRTLLSLFVAILGWSAQARAEDGLGAASLLMQADPRELQAILELARESIESGTHSAIDLAPEYLTLAIASARLGDETTAQRAFVILLGLAPTFRLKGEIADEIRSPYLEARGFWSAHQTPLQASATPSEDGSALILSTVDPAQLSARLRIRARAGDAGEPQEMVSPSAPQRRVLLSALGTSTDLSYSLTLLDEHGNRLWQLGSDEHPQRLDAQASEAKPSASPASIRPPPARQPRNGVRTHAIVGGLALGLGTVAVAAGAAAHLRRQRLAADWNAVQCDGPGTTRGSVCRDEREQLLNMQKLAGGLYGVGGVALVTGVLMLWLRPKNTERPAVHALRCASGPSELSMSCALSF